MPYHSNLMRAYLARFLPLD